MENFTELNYIRPDYVAAAAELEAIAAGMENAGSYEELRRLYLKMQQIMGSIRTMSSTAYIRNTLDKRDEFYDAEQRANSEGGAKLELSIEKVSRAMVGSRFRKDFDAEYGPHLMKEMEMGIRLTSPLIVEDNIEESNLCQTYARDAALCKTTFRGEECNFYGLLKHMESTDRDERREAFRAWADLYESVSDRLDETYDKLVKLRVGKAKKLGFDSYIDYIYPERGRFDYTPEDVESFRRQVREEIVPFCAELFSRQEKRLGIDKLHWYDEALIFPEGNALPIGNKDELVEKARQMYRAISPETGEFFDFMTAHGLFDLETRPGKHLGGYCTFLPDYKAPFIFSNFNGTSADVDVLTHEAGHAFEAYTASRALPLVSQTWSTSEINEIHSMAMEHFAYPWMESFFGDKADKYRYAHLCSALTSIPYLVSVDVFQHRVFEKPEMTASERRGVWREIEKTYMPWRDYDGNEFLEGGGFWMQKQHIFLYPFYYVDYALAQVCAFQLFALDRQDHEEAWNKYMKLCRAGGSMGYFELLDYAGLDNPFREGTVKKVMQAVKENISLFAEKL